MKARKIWILNHYAGSMFEAEGGRHYWFAHELNSRGYDVTVFCANSRYEREGEFFELDGLYRIEHTKDGVPYVFVKAVSYDDNGIDRLRDMVAFYANVKKAGKDIARTYGRPEIILASSVHPLTLVAGEYLARLWRVPCICEVRDLWPEAFFYSGAVRENSFLGRALMAGEHWIYRRASALIFLKPGDHEYIIENEWDTSSGGDIDMSRCFYINNGIKYDDFQRQIVEEAFDDKDLDDDSKKFIYAGTIRPTNNVGTLVDAASILADEGIEDVKILIYGSGSELEKLKEDVKTRGLNNIIFKGFVDKRKIPYVLTKSRATILNYTASGYNWNRGNSSNKLFEYMAAGKPVISTVKMAFSPIDEYQCGVSLEHGTPQELVEQLKIYGSMNEDNYAEQCRHAQEGARQFDYASLTDRLEHVIEVASNER